MELAMQIFSTHKFVRSDTKEDLRNLFLNL